MSLPVFEYFQEYYRVVATLYATDEGLFKELPDDLASAYIEVEVVYRICMANLGGEIRIYDFNNNPPAKNKDRQEGGAVMLDGVEWFTEAGPGGTALDLTTKYSSRFDTGTRAKIDMVLGIAKQRDNIMP